MAGLARLLGIPSRIAVGYTAGTNAGQRDLEGHHRRRSRLARAVLHRPRLDPLRADSRRPGGQGTATVPQYAAPPGIGTEPTTLAGQSSHAKAGARARRPERRPPAQPGPGRQRHRVAGRRPGPRHRPLGPADRGDRHRGSPLITPPTARSVVRRRRLQAAGDARLAHAAWREAPRRPGRLRVRLPPQRVPPRGRRAGRAHRCSLTRRPARPWAGSPAPRSARATRRRRFPRRRCARTAPRSGGRWPARRAGRSAGAHGCCPRRCSPRSGPRCSRRWTCSGGWMPPG